MMASTGVSTRALIGASIGGLIRASTTVATMGSSGGRRPQG